MYNGEVQEEFFKETRRAKRTFNLFKLFAQVVQPPREKQLSDTQRRANFATGAKLQRELEGGTREFECAGGERARGENRLCGPFLLGF